MSKEHDHETEREWEEKIHGLFLCELRILRRLVARKIIDRAGRFEPHKEPCPCPYCRHA